MEEIDRFQVPPVNGETQPLVRDKEEKQIKMQFWFIFVSIMKVIMTSGLQSASHRISKLRHLLGFEGRCGMVP